MCNTIRKKSDKERERERDKKRGREGGRERKTVVEENRSQGGERKKI